MLFFASCSGASAKKDIPVTGSKPLISFVFDDGNETDYTVAADIFSGQGEVASTAVVTDWVNTKDYLSVSQLAGLQQMGWEIMGHTVSHPNLRSLSEDRLEAELSQSKAALEGWGLHVRNMVYPYNKSNETVRRIAAKYYRGGRAGQKMLNSPASDPYDLKSFSCELSFWHKMSDIKSRIDRAYAEKKWLVLYQHLIDAKIRISGKSGAFLPGEGLSFMPSGATGKYIEDKWWSIEFVPLSGAPQPGDTVTGLSSGASAKLWEVYYNEREALTEMIEYVHKNYPDMQIVTIDKGLDLLEIR